MTIKERVRGTDIARCEDQDQDQGRRADIAKFTALGSIGITLHDTPTDSHDDACGSNP